MFGAWCWLCEELCRQWRVPERKKPLQSFICKSLLRLDFLPNTCLLSFSPEGSQTSLVNGHVAIKISIPQGYSDCTSNEPMRIGNTSVLLKDAFCASIHLWSRSGIHTPISAQRWQRCALPVRLSNGFCADRFTIGTQSGKPSWHQCHFEPQWPPVYTGFPTSLPPTAQPTSQLPLRIQSEQCGHLHWSVSLSIV